MKPKLKILTLLSVPIISTLIVSACGGSNSSLTNIKSKSQNDSIGSIQSEIQKDMPNFLLENQSITNDFQGILKSKDLTFENKIEFNTFYNKFRNENFMHEDYPLPSQGIVSSQTASLINHFNQELDWKMIDKNVSKEEINILYKEKEFCELASDLSKQHYNVFDFDDKRCGVEKNNPEAPADIDLTKITSDLPALIDFMALVANTTNYANKDNMEGDKVGCLGDEFFFKSRYDGKNYWDSPIMDLAGGRDELDKKCRLVSRITNRYDSEKTGIDELGIADYSRTINSEWYFPGYESPQTKVLWSWRPFPVHGLADNVINNKNDLFYQFAKNEDNWNLMSTKFVEGLKDGLMMSESWETLLRMLPTLKTDKSLSPILHKLVKNNSVTVPENEYSNGYDEFSKGKAIFYVGHKQITSTPGDNIKKMYSKDFARYWFKQHNITFSDLNGIGSDFDLTTLEEFGKIEFNKSQELVNWLDEVKFDNKNMNQLVGDSRQLMEDIKNLNNSFNSIVNY